jgi:4'-phosphopantetheinyl transferase EntD
MESTFDRRRLLLAGAWVAAAPTNAKSTPAPATPAAMTEDTLELWPSGVPGSGAEWPTLVQNCASHATAS